MGGTGGGNLALRGFFQLFAFIFLLLFEGGAPAVLPAPAGPPARSLPKRGFGVFWGFYVFILPPPPWLSGAVPGMRGAVTAGCGVPQTPASPTGPDPGSGNREQPGEWAHPCGTVSWESGDPCGGAPPCRQGGQTLPGQESRAPRSHGSASHTCNEFARRPLAALLLLPGPGWVKHNNPKSPGRLRAPPGRRCIQVQPDLSLLRGQPRLPPASSSWLHPALLPRGCWGGRRGGEIRGGILQCRIQVARRSH